VTQVGAAGRTTRLIAIQVAAVLFGLGLASGALAVTGGPSPSASLSTLWTGAVGSHFAVTQTALKAIPLALTGLAVALPLKLKLWNIGGEGQLYAGVVGAGFIALNFPDLPAPLMLASVIAAGAVAGCIWALLAAVPRALWAVDEIISTLMLNYVAILLVDYLVTGPWRSTQALNFPVSDPFPASTRLPALGTLGLHAGIFFPLMAGLLLGALMMWSKWGFELRMTASNPSAAAIVGIPVKRNILLTMAVAGALSGIGGMIEVTMNFGTVQQGLSPGYGYIGIVVATLAAGSMLGTVVLAFVMGGLVVGGLALQTLGVSDGFVLFLQGTILFFALLGSRLGGVRLLQRRERARVQPGESLEAVT
jgi:general nucleoside transport system permease protein